MDNGFENVGVVIPGTGGGPTAEYKRGWDAALSEAARTQCSDCAIDLPLVREKGGQFWHVRFIGDDQRISCDARAILALRGSEGA